VHPGQVAGELHVNGVIDGLVELIPDDPALPTYAGTYREKVDGVVTSFSDEGDVERIGQFRLRSTLQGHGRLDPRAPAGRQAHDERPRRPRGGPGQLRLRVARAAYRPANAGR